MKPGYYPETLDALSVLRKYIDWVEDNSEAVRLPTEDSLKLTPDEAKLFRAAIGDADWWLDKKRG